MASSYFLVAVSCWTTRKFAHELRERRAWWSISFLFLSLGIGKLLDLQSVLTRTGRILAAREGWYSQRRPVQFELIIFDAAICLIALVILLILVRRAAASTRAALLGATFLIGFVSIRAISLHQVDRLIAHKVLGLSWNSILEIGGIIVVLLASLWRRRGA